jgi:hypothetical protein
MYAIVISAGSALVHVVISQSPSLHFRKKRLVQQRRFYVWEFQGTILGHCTGQTQAYTSARN